MAVDVCQFRALVEALSKAPPCHSTLSPSIPSIPMLPTRQDLIFSIIYTSGGAHFSLTSLSPSPSSPPNGQTAGYGRQRKRISLFFRQYGTVQAVEGAPTRGISQGHQGEKRQKMEKFQLP